VASLTCGGVVGLAIFLSLVRIVFHLDEVWCLQRFFAWRGGRAGFGWCGAGVLGLDKLLLVVVNPFRPFWKRLTLTGLVWADRRQLEVVVPLGKFYLAFVWAFSAIGAWHAACWAIVSRKVISVMRTIQKLWTVVAGVLCALGVYATSAAANAYDQVELHSGASSGPTWSGVGNFKGSGSFIFHGSILTITCTTSTAQGTVDSADVGQATSVVFQGTGVVGCPGNGGTTWTIQPKLPWSIHQLYDQTTSRFVTIIDSVNVTLVGSTFPCKYAGNVGLFSDINQQSAVYGSQTNPSGGNPGQANFPEATTPLVRNSGNALVCPATADFTGTYAEQGLSGTTLFNIWERNQGARVQN
jgi:hypothetical protein